MNFSPERLRKWMDTLDKQIEEMERKIDRDQSDENIEEMLDLLWQWDVLEDLWLEAKKENESC